MAETRPKNYPTLKNYKPSRFMLPTSHYDAEKADRAVRFIENLRHTKGKWAGKRFWLLPWQEQIIRDVFGIVDERGNRQFRTAYDFNDGTYEVVPAAVFEDVEWSVRLVMEVEHRMENNRSKAVAINEAASLDCDGSDWSDAVMVDFMDEENVEMLAEEELRKLYAAI